MLQLINGIIYTIFGLTVTISDILSGITVEGMVVGILFTLSGIFFLLSEIIRIKKNKQFQDKLKKEKEKEKEITNTNGEKN